MRVGKGDKGKDGEEKTKSHGKEREESKGVKGKR